MEAIGDRWIGLGPDDVSVATLPAFHIGGMWWAIQCLTVGAQLVLMETFQAPRLIELVRAHSATKFCLVPAMMRMVLSDPTYSKEAFASVDCIVYGGSPIGDALQREAALRFGCRITQIYGLTETGNCAVTLRPEDHDGAEGSARMRAAGKPFPGVEICVLDPEGRRRAHGEVGEIAIKSPSNMLGYWKRPEATAATLEDGWLHTGDAGTIDADGYVTISDRVKDMIICAGENIYSVEIENALSHHPAVAEVAVIGVPDDRWGETVHAFVVSRPGTTAKPSELLAAVRGRIADFKLPRGITLVDSLPRTPSGKIEKWRLRERFWQGRTRNVN
jgi:long-chain acyl-CoA synthetase